jgi:hypothetical protein
VSNANLVYEDLIARGKAERTARSWGAIVHRFEVCCGVRGSYGRGDVIRFLAELRQAGLRQSSIDTMLRPIRLLCEVQKWDGGFPKLSMPKVRRSDIKRPCLSIEEVGALIRKAKKVCSERELAYLAAATVYGLRREELGTLLVYDGVVKVNTLKGGDVTVHLVPGEIKDFIQGYRGSNDVRYMTRVFWRIVDKVGLGLGSGYGWHSIRRALATELLLRDASLIDIMRFMRWSDASLQREFGMLSIYAERRQDVIDKNIFKVHPFLGFW